MITNNCKHTRQIARKEPPLIPITKIGIEKKLWKIEFRTKNLKREDFWCQLGVEHTTVSQWDHTGVSINTNKNKQMAI